MSEPLLKAGDLELEEIESHKAFLTNPHKWFRHPILRIIFLFLVLFMDFFTYGKDPSQDSKIHSASVGVGQLMGLLSMWHAPNWQFALMKLGCFLATLAMAVVVGKAFKWFMIKIRFRAFDSGGGTVSSWIVGLFISAFAVDMFYNSFMVDEPNKYDIDAHSLEFLRTIFRIPSMSNQDMGKMWQGISTTLDWLAIWQITDSVFQDQKYWVNFMPGFKKFYLNAMGGKFRVYFFWIGFPFSVVCTCHLLSFTGNQPGQISWEIPFIHTYGEVWRSVLAGIIVFLDLFCMVQDWEYPLFSEHHHDEADKTKLAGSDGTSAKILGFEITAKWMQYGPLVGVMGADFAFVKSMMGYTPQTYGEYVDPRTNRLWVITNTTLLDEVYPLGTNRDPSLLEQISFAARRNLTTGHCLPTVPDCEHDVLTSSKFYNTQWDFIGVVLAVFFFVGFLILTATASSEATIELEMSHWHTHSTHKEKKQNKAQVSPM